jgi:hypothetical protein
MRNPAMFGLVVLSIACSGSSETVAPGEDSFAALLSGTAQTYVLGIVEDQRTDPIITFDHQCAGIRRQTLMRDTIQLFPNGEARRGFQIQHLANGEVVGTWTGSSQSLASGSHVSLQLTPPSGSSYLMTLKVSGRAGLSTYSALGGVCNGSTLDGRTAEFFWTNR